MYIKPDEKQLHIFHCEMWKEDTNDFSGPSIISNEPTESWVYKYNLELKLKSR